MTGTLKPFEPGDEHVTRAVTTQAKMDAHGTWYRWECSCGKSGESTFAHENQAKSAGLEHANAKNAHREAGG